MIIKHAFKLLFIVYGLFVVSALSGCTTEEGDVSTGGGSYTRCDINIDAGDDANGTNTDCSFSPVTDNSVTNPEPEEVEEAE